MQGLDGVDTHLSRGIVPSCVGCESGIRGMQRILCVSPEKLIYCIEIIEIGAIVNPCATFPKSANVVANK